MFDFQVIYILVAIQLNFGHGVMDQALLLLHGPSKKGGGVLPAIL